MIALIKRRARENFLWGAPRIHGEFLKIGIKIAESIVAKYRPRHRDRGGGQSWRIFLANELDGIAALDMMTVPAIMFDQLHALVQRRPDQYERPDL